MQWYNNMKLSYKLLLGFALVAMITGIVGAVGSVEMNGMSQSDSVLYNNMTLPMEYSSVIYKNFERINVKMSTISYRNDSATIEKEVANVEAMTKEIAQQESLYKGTISSEQDKKSFDAFSAAYQAYQPRVQHIIELARQNRDQEAYDYYYSAEVQANRDLVRASLDNLIQEKDDSAEAAAARNKQNAQSAIMLMIGLVLGGILLAIVLGVFISRRITRPLQQLVDASNLLSMGDVDIRLDYSSKDEVGILVDSFKRMADNIKEQAQTASAIAKGKLDVDCKPRSEADLMGKSLSAMIQTINAALAEVNKLIKAVQEGKLDIRGSASGFEGSWAELVGGLNALVDAFAGPINVTTEYVESIANGNIPPRITDDYKGDFNEIKNNLNACIDGLGGLLEANEVLQLMAINDYTRTVKGSYQGIFAQVAEAVNGVQLRVGSVSDAIIRMSKGDLSRYAEAKAVGRRCENDNIVPAIVSSYESLKELVEQAQMLSDAAINGQLSTRGDISRFSGVYQDVIKGFNATLDAVINPLNVAAEYVDRISKGDVPPRITDSYNGDFNEIKNNLNSAIDAVNLLVSDAKMLSTAAVEGRLDTRADASRHQGDFKAIVQGVNETLDSVIEPIKEAAQVLEEMSKGRLDVQVAGNYMGDHANLKEALNSTITSIKAYISEIANVLQEMTQGNLDVAIIGDYRGDFIALKSSLNAIINAFNDVIGEINQAASQVSAGSNQVADSSQSLSQAATEQAAAIQQITASVAQIAGQTKENAFNAQKANEFAVTACEQATDGNKQMQEMLIAMKQINEASSRISKIIKVIDEIAFQTNILALNAAVEAARAGEHGKGFAVVAEEVRNLAARSANAAKETTDMIEGSMRTVEVGTGMAQNTADALDRIVDGVSKATELMGDIAVASNQQATGVTQIDTGITQVAEIIQMNTATSEQSAAASQQLSSQAEVLKQRVSHFRLKRRSVSRDHKMTANYNVMQPVINVSPYHGGANDVLGYNAGRKVLIDMEDHEFGKY